MAGAFMGNAAAWPASIVYDRRKITDRKPCCDGKPRGQQYFTHSLLFFIFGSNREQALAK